VSLEDITLSEISQTKRQILDDFIYVSYLVQSSGETRVRLVIARGCGEGKISCCSRGIEFLFCKRKELWGLVA
jgi:hypothetical protein